MNKLIQIIGCVMILIAPLMAEPMITISGSALSGLSNYNQAKNDVFYSQFETAANLVFDVELNQAVQASLDVGIGGDQNQTGYSQGVSLSSTALIFKPSLDAGVFGGNITEFKLGNQTIPYGQFAEMQTSNSYVPSPFLINDLGYALLSAGADVTDFSGTGVQTTFEGKQDTQIDAMVFNGTNGTDNNVDQGFGWALRAKVKPFGSHTILGVSWLSVNDRTEASSEGINADLRGIIVDIKTNINDLTFGGYISFLNANDFDTNTKDDANVLMVYVSRTIENLTLSGRYSIYKPGHYKGLGNGSDGLRPINVGFGDVTGDVEVVRIQAAARVEFMENITLNNELVFDSYGKNREDFNTTALISYASISF